MNIMLFCCTTQVYKQYTEFSKRTLKQLQNCVKKDLSAHLESEVSIAHGWALI